MKQKLQNPIVLTVAVICFCFLLTSTGWLAWEYHLLEQADVRTTDRMTMVAGYLLQAAGIGVYAVLLRARGTLAGKLVPLVMILHTLCLIPAILSPTVAGTLVSGFAVCLFCGYIGGWYLHFLTRRVAKGKRASSLGAGYGVSILLSWLFSTFERLYYSDRVWILCLFLTAVTLFLFQTGERLPEKEPGELRSADRTRPDRGLLLGVGGTVLLFSIVNNLGFSFSSADFSGGMRPELSRLFYAAGLILAGILADRERQHSAMAALFALVVPFVMLALRKEPVPLAVFWALSYFTYGFLSVFRMVVFSDLAEAGGLLYLSGFGLLIGRVGDAVGEGICLSLSTDQTALVFLTALLFLAAGFLFFRVYRPLYIPEEKPERSEVERFYVFAAEHELTSREQDMLRLILEKKTNGEIADALFVSESTVKFHVRNLLKKTGYKNRNELVTAYFSRSER